MNCAANKSRKGCAQGHQPCPTPYTCNYANEAHERAMTAPVGSFYPRDMAITLEGPEPADPPLYTPSQAMLWPCAVTLIALLCAAWAAVLGLPWLYLNWARVVAALGAL